MQGESPRTSNPTTESSPPSGGDVLHLFYPRRLHPIYDRFREYITTSSSVTCVYQSLPGYEQIAAQIREFEHPFVAELSLTRAVQLVDASRGTASEMVVIGSPTSFARGTEIAALFYPQGKLHEVDHLEIADAFSVNTWLALMFLKSEDVPLLRDASRLRARLRVTDYKLIFSYVLEALRAGVRPLIGPFLAAGYPREFDELLTASEGTFEHMRPFDWYMEKVSQVVDSDPPLTLHSRLTVARRRDVERKVVLYTEFTDSWRSWKAEVTQPGQRFHMLTTSVTPSNREIALACEFLDKAHDALGEEILGQLGFDRGARLESDRDFWQC